jgi:hypothetical protein
LLVVFGEQRDRFQNADELQKYAGIAPSLSAAVRRVGSTGGGSARHLYGKRLLNGRGRRLINKSFWAGAFYHQQRNKGCSRQGALAFKWIRILFLLADSYAI